MQVRQRIDIVTMVGLGMARRAACDRYRTVCLAGAIVLAGFAAMLGPSITM